MRTCGFHVQRTSDELRQAIAAVQPTVILSLAHDRDFWQNVKRDHPGIFLVGRLYEHGVDWRDVDPDDWAEQCAALGMPYDAFITRNEPEDVYNWVSADLAARHDDWCCEFRRRILELGYQAVALNVPTGHFHKNAVANLFPNVCQEFDYIGLHEYSAAAMWDQDPKKKRAWGDVPQDEGEEIGYWYCQRYRDWHDGIVARWPGREGKFKMVVTECGVEYGVVEKEGWTGGWQTRQSEDQYVESLKWYFGAMNDDPYCLGGAIFMVGHEDANWASYETLDIYGRLLEIDEPNGNGGNGMAIKIYDFDNAPPDGATTTWDWLVETFGDVQIRAIEDKVTLGDGDVVYKLDYLDARLGDANIIINVRDVDGEPEQGKIVVFGWPEAPEHSLADKPSNWTANGVTGDTDGDGNVGPGLGTGSYYSPDDGERGPHFVWVYDLPSDYVDGLGMIAGTNHAHLNVGYKAAMYEEGGGNGSEHAERLRDIAGELWDIADELDDEGGGIDKITVTWKSGVERVFKPVETATQKVRALLAGLVGR